MESLSKILVFILVILIALNMFLIFRNLSQSLSNISFENKSYAMGDEFSHSEKLHWTHMPLTYKIINCSDYQERRIIRAFDIIENETNYSILFVNDSEEIDIDIICNKEYKLVPERPGYLTSGESGYWIYENYPYKIAKAEINFYGIRKTTYSGGCIVYPDIEIHEILHAFGYGHNDDRKSIMYPDSIECIRSIDEDIVNELIEIYRKD